MVKIRGKQSRGGYLWCPSWRGKTRWGTHLREIQSSHLKWVTFDGFQCRPGRNVKQTVDWCGKFHGEASVTGNTCKSTAVRCLLEAKTNKGNNVDREESHSYALVMQKRKSLGKRGCDHSERGGGTARKWVRGVGRMPQTFPKFPKTSCPPYSPKDFQKSMGWHLSFTLQWRAGALCPSQQRASVRWIDNPISSWYLLVILVYLPQQVFLIKFPIPGIVSVC